jgi:molybdate transport system substrate-binding protein
MRLAVIVVAALLVATCDSGTGSERTLRVVAAASLTEAFTDLEQTFERKHPDVDVIVSFDSSAILVEQLSQGLRADVLATADERSMDEALAAGVVTGTPEPFATNTLVIVTPPGNPGKVGGLDDLADATVAACVPAAPCGDATRRLLELNRVAATPITEEENVKGVLTKVTSGEVDAGLVYASDANAAGDRVEVVPAANAADVVNVDPIAVVKDSANAEAARDWIELVTSEPGQRVLERHGFGPRR